MNVKSKSLASIDSKPLIIKFKESKKGFAESLLHYIISPFNLKKGPIEMLLVLLIDLYVVASVYILLTGGTVHLSPALLEFIKANPKAHRFVLSAITSSLIMISIIFKWRKELYQRSLIKKLCDIFFLSTGGAFWVGLMFIVLSTVYATASLVKHYVFETSFDMAIFTQAIWSSAHGKLLYSSIKGGICLLGDHVSPILVVYAWIYKLWENPISLLMMQSILCASSVFPIYLIARKIVHDGKISLIFPLSLAVYLPLRNASRFDFHPEFIATPLFLWAYYFLILGKLRITSLLLAVILMTKEVACFPVAGFAFYSFLFLKKYRFGLLWMVLAVLLFIMDVKIIAPYFSQREYFYLGGNYLAWFERGPLSLAKHLLQPSTFTYFKKIFLPVGFFSFLSPSFILTVPALLQNLIANNPLARSTYFHYTFYLTPFVFISVLEGFRSYLNFFQKRKPSFVKHARLFAIYWFLGWSFLLAGVSEVHVVHQYWRQNDEHLNYIRSYIKKIPSHLSLRTHERLAPHLANRFDLHIYENNNPLEGGSLKAMQSEMVVVDRHFLKNPDSELEQIVKLGYHLEHEHDGFYVFIRKPGALNEINP